MQNNKKLSIIIPLVILGALIIFGGGGYLAYKYFAAGQVEQEVKQAIADMQKQNPGLEIKYDNLSMSLQTGMVNLQNVKISHQLAPVSLSAESVSVRDLTSLGITFFSSALIMKNATITVPKGKIGIESLESSTSLSRIPTKDELNADPAVIMDVLRQADLSVKNISFVDKKGKFNLGSAAFSFAGDKSSLKFSKFSLEHQEFGKGRKLGIDDLGFSASLSRVVKRQELATDWTVIFDVLQQADFSVKNIAFSDKQGKFSLGTGTIFWSADKGKKAGFSLSGFDIALPELKLAFENYTSSVTLDPKHVAVQSDIKLKNLLFTPPASPAKGDDPFKFLRDLGYSSLKLNLDGKGDYNPQTLDDTSFVQFSGENMGTLSLDLKGTGHRRPPLPLRGSLLDILNLAQEWQKAMDQYALASAKLSYQDAGLSKRLLQFGAKTAGKTPQAFSQEIVEGINAGLMLFPLPPAIKEQVKAVNQFIMNPNEIVVSLSFKTPMRLKELKDPSPEQVLQLLGQADFKITAK